MAFTKKVVAGQTIAAADFAKFFGDHFSEFVKTGFEVSEGTGLIVDISAGTAYVKDATGYMYQIVSSGTETATLADDNTNYVFLHSDNGATYITDSTTATVPDDAILLATVVCASGDVSTVTDGRVITPAIESLNVWTRPLFWNGNTTTTEYYYFNPSGNRIINFKTFKCEVLSKEGSGCTITVYYNVGAGEVQAAAFTSTVGAKSVSLNVANTSTSFEPYIKLVFYSPSSSAGWVGNFRMDYTIQ